MGVSTVKCNRDARELRRNDVAQEMDNLEGIVLRKCISVMGGPRVGGKHGGNQGREARLKWFQ